MKVRAKFFATFQTLFAGRTREVGIPEGGTVGDALIVLCDTAARRAAIFDGDGLKAHLIVMVNGTPVTSLAGLLTPLVEGDTLAVFPMLGGG